MAKTVFQALLDEVHYPLAHGFVENVLIKRGLNRDETFTQAIAHDPLYKGALADCLYSLVQAINFSEADKSVGNLSDTQRKIILKQVNSLYASIGEKEVDTDEPRVYWGG